MTPASPNPILAPLAAQLPKLKPEDRVTLTKEYLAKKLPQWEKLSADDQGKLVNEVVTKYGGAADPPAAPRQSLGRRLLADTRVLGRNTATTVGAMAPVVAGAEMGAQTGAELGAFGGPAGVAIGGLAGGAIGAGAGGLAAPAGAYLMRKVTGLAQPGEEPPSWKDNLESAADNAKWQLYLGPLGAVGDQVLGAGARLAEKVLGIGDARGLLEQGRNLADEDAAKLAEQQQQIRADRETKIRGVMRKTGEEASALDQQQEGLRIKQRLKRTEAARQAETEHSQAIAEARQQVDQSLSKLKERKQAVLEKAHESVAERVGAASTQTMLGKDRGAFQAQAAQEPEQLAARLNETARPVFDAAARYHEQVGAKFEPYLKSVQNQDIAPLMREKISDTLNSALQTTEERGQRIESSELRQIADTLKSGAGGAPSDYEAVATVYGAKEADRLRKGSPQMLQGQAALARRVLEQATQQGRPLVDAKPLTYGELWGLRARANRVLSQSKNPADRAFAHEIVDVATQALPNVPPEIRSEYAFERKLIPSILRKVATARTPQEVGEAIFGGKNSPEPAELPLQIIRFTRKYAPEQMDGIREGFADRYFGNQMTPDDLGKMNPAILRELYGQSADDVLRLLGPEGKVKSASWATLIRTDPQVQRDMRDAIRSEMGRYSNRMLNQALQEGRAALTQLQLPESRVAAIKAAVDKARLPEEKLAILAKALPDSQQAAREFIQEHPLTSAQKATLAKTSPERETAARQYMSEHLKPGRFEGYMQRRMVFMGIMATAGFYTYLFKRPAALLTTLALMGGLGGRELARGALGTERGASLYMKALNMEPTPGNAAAFARLSAALVANMGAKQAPAMTTGPAPKP